MSYDNDYELALLLQLEYDTEIEFEGKQNFDDKSDCKTLTDLESSLPNGYDIPDATPPKKKSPRKNQVNTLRKDGKKMSIIDPQWELLDPVPDIHALFLQYNGSFFYSELASAEVRWSPRMTLCAGLCVYERRGGFCSIRLSAPLLKLRPRKDLVETLLHEMIHAYLFLTHNNKDHDDHGPEFKKHMTRINNSEGTNISVYHSFHDEVDFHRQHWWRCDGPCKDRKPFFGWVKRSMNRAPSARDPWWRDHVATCGGTYTKVREPEGYKKKGEKKKKEIGAPTTSTAKSFGANKTSDGGASTSSGSKTSFSQTSRQGKDIRNFFQSSTSVSIDVDAFSEKLTNGSSESNYRDKQAKSAKVIDNIGKGLSSRGNIQAASGLLNLTEKTSVGDGVGKHGNIHSVGKFLKGESTKSPPLSVSSVSAFTGGGNTLGGSTGQPTSGCHKSRLLTVFDAGARGQKRKSVEFFEDANKKAKPTGIRNSIKSQTDNAITNSNDPTKLKSKSAKKRREIPDFFGSSPSPPRHKPVENKTSNVSEVSPETVPCPVCASMVAFAEINDHLNSCLT